MDFFFEILTEIAELLLDVAVEGVQDKKHPRGLRIGLAVLLSLLYIVVTVMFVILSLQNDHIAFRVLLAVVIIFLTGLIGRMWYKFIKNK